ncbi:MAG: pteridine reductase [Gammaproteobacteria bacterium]|nr:pteridine reductase [Gammaproteobacteria bacterium]
MDTNPLTDKVLLITGGAQRIGADICRLLHAEGMRLLIHYRNSGTEAEALKQELEQQRAHSVDLVHGDLLNSPNKLRQLVSQAVKTFGQLDVLLNNASGFYPTPVHLADEAQWDDLMGTNLKAPYFLSQAAAPHLKSTAGCIINIADIHADRPLKDHSIYCMAKAGLVMMTQSLARDLAPDIRVNAIAPGAILWPEPEPSNATKTQAIAKLPLQRLGDPRDIARSVRFLIRDADYITGQVITVCGGKSVTL